jgi:hypothetical protein
MGVVWQSTASAQGLENLGSRAPALGAFVAVADDASAVAWNPAGMVMGPLFNISIGLGRSSAVPDGPPIETEVAERLSATLVAFGVPPVGLSYYRLGMHVVEGGAASGDPRREDGQVVVRTIVTSHLGVTVLQSLGNFLTVGSTVKLVRGTVGSEVAHADTWDAAFDHVDTLMTTSSTTGDLDLGALAAAGRWRAGLVVRNVTEPDFEDAFGGEVELTRHARAGVAWGDRWPGVSRMILAFDVDLTHAPHPDGDRRDVAAGIERWTMQQQRLGLRAGVRASTVGEARPIVSAGASYAIRSGTFVDAYVARGASQAMAWGIAARLSY